MKNMKLKKKNLLIIIAAVVILIVIIGVFVIFKKDDKQVLDNKGNSKEPTNGEVTIIDENSKSRPIAFTIDNSDAARPLHTGLQKAYLVYEIINYADGRTRFLALYKDSDVAKVGPIRSVRHYHLDYVQENDAILAHWGQSTIAGENLSKLKINHINGITYGSSKTEGNVESGRYFWTDAGGSTDISHRRFTSMNLINSAIDKLKITKTTEQTNLLKYSAKPVETKDMENSQVANNIDIYYSSSNYTTYTYDEESGSYLRSVKGEKHIDNATNEQIKVKNIIVYKVNNYTIPGNADILQELENVGSGDGYYITNGYAVPIKWSKEDHDKQTKYTYLNGEEIILNDGNTFIQIQPKDKELKIS